MTDFVAVNALEEALVRAADDPTARPDFYRVLREAQLFFVDTQRLARAERPGIVEAGTRLSIRTLDVEGTPHLEVFSSVRRIQEAISSPVAYLSCAALDLFDTVQGAHVILNPGAAYGKHFTPDEIRRVADGSILQSQSTYVDPGGHQVRIAQPAVYPSHVTDRSSGTSLPSPKSGPRTWPTTSTPREASRRTR